MEFISIGPYCCGADIITKNGLRQNSYPFDYLFSSLAMVKHAIGDRFNVFLDKNYHKYCSESSTQHLFYCKYIDTEIIRKQHIAAGELDIANDLTNRAVFIHHNLFNNETYLAFVRRSNRLLHLIDTGKKIVFVYYNVHTIDLEDVIDFSNNFSDNKNICVVGIFENGGDKKMLFNTSNCKVYQNYDKAFIFNEIKSTF